MALELFRAVDCIRYIGSEPKLPGLEIKVKESLFGRKKSFTAPIDTGFAGYLLLSSDVYSELGTMELPRVDFGVYSTLSGSITLRRAEVTLQVGNRELSTFIETPLHGTGKILLGRRVLSELNLALLGRTMMCCHLRSTSK